MATTSASSTRSSRSGPTREAIVRAATQVLGRHGLGGASVRAVATQAGVSVGTVMYHFEGGIEQLQRVALERVMESLYARRLKVVAGSRPVLAKLAEMIERGVPDVIDADLTGVYTALPQVIEDPLLAAAHRELVERQVSLYVSLLEVAVDEGLAPSGLEVEDVARNVVALEDAYDLYPLLGLEAGGGAARRRRVRGYLELVLGRALP